MLRVVLYSFGISLIINLGLFILAYINKSDKLTDASYALTFLAVAFSAFAGGFRYNTLLLVMVSVWAIRIGSFLLYRVIKAGKDARFDGMRENFIKFGQFWLGQAVTVPVILLPVIFGFSHPLAKSTLLSVGFVIWLGGLIIESFADMQKYRFNNNAKNKGNWIDSGVWRYSRHPNYFGEICVWVGIYLFVWSALTPAQRLAGAISPVYITTLLIFVSGIPILEKSADKRWGKLPAYKAYKKRTSMLIPLPPKR